MLSGGQKQRVAIAGALAMEPQLLVFDEATAMLDPKGRQEILEIIHYLNREKGMTILLITHFMEEAVEADRVFVLSGGLVLAQGTPKEIFPQAELLKEARLLPPFAAAMAQTLREAGIEIPQEIITMEALADAISQKWPAGVIPRIEEIERPAEGTLEGEVPILEAKALSYTYMPGTPFEHKALDDVSLSIREGEFIGIVGHTGSGKSTLIQLLSGLIPKTQGEILVAGKDIWAKDYDKKELRRTVGVVFQYPEYQLFEETVEKDIQFGPKKTGIPEEELESRTRVAMELVGLDYDAYREKSPFELSGGQKRKAAIAGVLAMEPKVLIMDEPIAGLDPMGRTSLMDLVRDLRDCGVTVIMISHNMEGLAEYASRILVMQKGRLVLDGPPEEIFSNYQAFREAGLDIPEAAQMAELLQERNIPIPSSCIRYGQLANCLIEGMRGESHD